MSPTAPGWEYASFVFVSWAKKEKVPSPPPRPGEVPPDSPSFKWIYFRDWWLYLPGEDPEKHEEWRSDVPDETKINLLDLMNRVGAEGWELVSDTVLRSGVNLQTVGWGTASEPLRRVLFFKRPTAS